MKTICKFFLVAGILLIFTGCTHENGPTIDFLLHGTASHAHFTKNLMKIPENKTIYIDDITGDKDPYTPVDLAYSGYIFSTKICAPGEETKKVLKNKGYNIVDKKDNADYIITMQNLGCGVYGKIKNHLHTPKKIRGKIDNNIKGVETQNINSVASLSSTLSQTGHSTASKATLALGFLSLFDSPDRNYMTFDAITVYDKNSGILKQSIFYSPCFGEGIKNIMRDGSKEIAKKLYTEISSSKFLGM